MLNLKPEKAVFGEYRRYGNSITALRNKFPKLNEP